MRRVSFIVGAMLAIGTASAQAQSSAVTGPYAALTTGVTVASGAAGLLGAEVGLRLNTWDLFFETGRMFNTKTKDMDTAATVISQFLATGGKTVTFEAKQPVTYFDIALRYKFPTSGRMQPYATLGIGGAHVARNVAFIVNGTDVTAQLQSANGILLGGDLSGTENGALFMLGAGVQSGIGDHRLFWDGSYRYGRVFLQDGGLNTNRLQFGIGVRF